MEELKSYHANLIRKRRRLGDEIDAKEKRLAILRLSTPDVESITDRMKLVFDLRTKNTSEAVELLSEALIARPGPNDVLLRHELAFCLGQMDRKYSVQALDALWSVLRDENDDSVVRHEAAEALGAIGHKSSLPILKRFVDHPVEEIRSTVRLSIELLEDPSDSHTNESEYASIDPAKPFDEDDTEEARARWTTALLDVQVGLAVRYRALFSLRNAKDVDAVARALVDVDAQTDSALLRHEVCYVLGQLEDARAVGALESALKDLGEHDMVRHEAAEALGAIGNEECVVLLEEFSTDDSRVVSESCRAALDTLAYWKEFNAVKE